MSRAAYFGAGDVEVLPQTGQAIDVSRDGVLIRTARPLPEGAAIEVELRPEAWRPAKELILTRGRVSRIVDHGDGEFDMGVHLHVPAGTRLSTTKKHALHDVGSLVANLRPRETGYGHAGRFGWSAASTRRRYRNTRSDVQTSNGWRTWFWPIAILLAGLLLMLFLWPLLLNDSLSSGDLQRHPANSGFHSPVSNQATPDIVEESSRNPLRPQNPSPEAHETVPSTQPPVIELRWPGERQPQLFDADYPADQNRQQLNGPHSFRASPRETRSTAYGAADSVLLEADRRSHRMRLYINGALRQEFAIGLGRGNSTPAGEFTVANKLTNPDWYNGGDVVPAGHPDNPLGRRWLGLARDGALTPYGIHATNDRASIGGNASQGCIRLSPDDADTLFRLCPVGTRVIIR